MNTFTVEKLSLVVIGFIICLLLQNCGSSPHHHENHRGGGSVDTGCRWGVNGCPGVQLCEPLRAESEEMVCNLDNSNSDMAECTKRNQVVTCCSGSCSCCASNHDPNNCENECSEIMYSSRQHGNNGSAIVAK